MQKFHAWGKSPWYIFHRSLGEESKSDLKAITKKNSFPIIQLFACHYVTELYLGLFM